jgi:2-dehydropantoate 2-reductase
VTLWIVGGGAVGLTLAARLARAGEPVRLVVRRPEAAAAIARAGVRLEDPASGESFQVAVPATAGIAGARDVGRGPVLVCARANDTEEVAAALAGVAPEAVVASAQNDVDNEEVLARRFRRVLGVVYRQTCTRVDDAFVRALGAGRMIVGAHPEGGGEDVEALAASLRRAGYDVGVSARIGEDKWLKLCVNLMSAPNALVVREDHATRAFVETKAHLLEEARAALAAAGIAARSCDGRDRSLDQEVDFQRAAIERGESGRPLPIYNQVWQALRSGAALEADRYHRRILDLAARHGVSAPVNARVLAVLEAVAREGRGPESVRAEELLPADPAR